MLKIEKKISIIFIVLLMLIAIFSSIVTAQIKLNFPHMYAVDGLPHQGAMYFKELVEQKTNGEVIINVVPGAALGNELDNIQQLKTGSVDFFVGGDTGITVLARPFQVLAMPFLYRSMEHALKARSLDGPIGKKLNEYIIKEQGVRILGWQIIGQRHLTSNIPVYTLEDLPKIKLRMPENEIWIKAWQAVGARTAVIPFPEVWLALQTGTVDAQENPVDFIISQKFYEVQKYLILSAHHQNIHGLYMNEKSFQKLTDEQKEIILESAKKHTEFVTSLAKKVESEGIEFLKNYGLEIITPDFTGYEDKVKEVPQKLLGEEGEKMYQEIVNM